MQHPISPHHQLHQPVAVTFSRFWSVELQRFAAELSSSSPDASNASSSVTQVLTPIKTKLQGRRR